MIILTPIERETLQVFFLKKARAQSCRGLPLGSSSITAAVALVDRDMLTRVWDEMYYRTDVCRITIGDTLSICEMCKKKTLVTLSVFFSECIRKLMQRWTKCVEKQGDYLEK
jgi:hypothetical protein